MPDDAKASIERRNDEIDIADLRPRTARSRKTGFCTASLGVLWMCTRHQRPWYADDGRRMPKAQEQRREALVLAHHGASGDLDDSGTREERSVVTERPVWPLVIDGLARSEALNFTLKQGQYLAFIYYYTKINGRSPSEADMQRYFKVTAPSVHQMIITLERLHLLSRTPGQGRSIQLRLTRKQLPDLE